MKNKFNSFVEEKIIVAIIEGFSGIKIELLFLIGKIIKSLKKLEKFYNRL